MAEMAARGGSSAEAAAAFGHPAPHSTSAGAEQAPRAEAAAVFGHPGRTTSAGAEQAPRVAVVTGAPALLPSCIIHSLLALGWTVRAIVEAGTDEEGVAALLAASAGLAGARARARRHAAGRRLPPAACRLPPAACRLPPPPAACRLPPPPAATSPSSRLCHLAAEAAGG